MPKKELSRLDQAYDPEAFRKEGIRLVNQIADYLEKCQNREMETVYPAHEPDALLKLGELWMEEVAEKGIGTLFEWILEESIHLHHPGFMGHQVSPALPQAALADLLGSLLNNGVGVYEMGSPAVVLESIVAKRIAGAAGLPAEADGFLTSGGTLGNLTALLCARQVTGKDHRWNRGTGDENLCILVSEQLHYSLERAVKIMGWGDGGVVPVPVDSRFKMDLGKLEEIHERVTRDGKQIIAVVGGACTTSVGSFDPLDEIAGFCQQHNLWFHVDAAHGGAAIFSGRYNHLLEGIQKADSVIIDLHKMMMHPALVTAIIFRDGKHSYRTFSQKADYLWEQNDEEWYSLGKRTFECTKGMLGVKAAAMFATYGEEMFGDIVDRLFDLAKSAAEIMEGEPDFELALRPEANILCFRYIPEGLNDAEVDELNRWLRKEIIGEGRFFIVQTSVNGRIYLRTALMNVHTTPDDFLDLLKAIRIAWEQRK